MNGRITKLDIFGGGGEITDAYGNTLDFDERDWLGQEAPKRGDSVIFTGMDGQAVAVKPYTPKADYAAFGQGAAMIDPAAGLGFFGYIGKAWRKSFDWTGRAQRVEYWSFAAFWWVYLFFGLLLGPAAVAPQSGVLSSVLILIWALGLIATIPASLGIRVRRLHDAGMTGWLVLLTFVPYIGGLFLLVVSLLPSQEHTNDHGPHPKANPYDVF